MDGGSFGRGELLGESDSKKLKTISVSEVETAVEELFAFAAANPEQALAAYEGCLVLLSGRETVLPLLTGIALVRAGQVLLHGGRVHQARSYAERALRVSAPRCRDVGSACCALLVCCALRCHKVGEAQRVCETGVQMGAEGEVRESLRQGKAEVLDRKGKRREAVEERMTREKKGGQQQQGQQGQQGGMMMVMMMEDVGVGRYEEARDELREMMKRKGNKEKQAQLVREMGQWTCERREAYRVWDLLEWCAAVASRENLLGKVPSGMEPRRCGARALVELARRLPEDAKKSAERDADIEVVERRGEREVAKMGIAVTLGDWDTVKKMAEEVMQTSDMEGKAMALCLASRAARMCGQVEESEALQKAAVLEAERLQDARLLEWVRGDKKEDSSTGGDQELADALDEVWRNVRLCFQLQKGEWIVKDFE